MLLPETALWVTRFILYQPSACSIRPSPWPRPACSAPARSICSSFTGRSGACPARSGRRPSRRRRGLAHLVVDRGARGAGRLRRRRRARPSSTTGASSRAAALYPDIEKVHPVGGPGLPGATRTRPTGRCLLAGSVIVTAPLVLIFLAAQPFFLEPPERMQPRARPRGHEYGARAFLSLGSYFSPVDPAAGLQGVTRQPCTARDTILLICARVALLPGRNVNISSSTTDNAMTQ